MVLDSGSLDRHATYIVAAYVAGAADDLARLLGDAFTIELHAVEPRIDPPPDNPHIADVVLRPASLKRGPDECSGMAGSG